MVNVNQQLSAAPVFTGEFRHKIEGKNRITIPSAWRFEQEVDLFMIRKTQAKCISVMPLCEVERIKSVANAKSPKERSAFLDFFGGNLRRVTLDKAGRISIPDDLCKRMNISGEVMLSGSVETFNVWNVTDFESANPEAEDEVRRTNVLGELGI